MTKFTALKTSDAGQVLVASTLIILFKARLLLVITSGLKIWLLSLKVAALVLSVVGIVFVLISCELRKARRCVIAFVCFFPKVLSRDLPSSFFFSDVRPLLGSILTIVFIF